MKTRKISYLSALLAGTLCLTSCELDEYNPSGGDATIESYDAWAGLQAYCYSPLAEQLYSVYDFLSVAEGGTDMWLTPGGNPDYAPELIYYEGLTTSTNATNKVFRQAYTCIASCNAVINNVDNVQGGEDDAKKVLVAEAKTLRAFYNLLLVTYYGPVTLSQEDVSVGEINTTPTRNTVEEFYQSITTDLKEASADLGVQPYQGNYARVCKKTALGLLARAYAQGAGEGLTEDGVSYWQRARDVAEDIIDNASSYDVYLYDDVSDLWAQANNLDNPEALFIVTGRDVNTSGYNYTNYNNNLFRYTVCNPNSCADIYAVSNSSNYYLGDVNVNSFAPSKYSIDVFDASWDKRYENTFMTAFGRYSMQTDNWQPFAGARTRITPNLITKYGMGEEFQGQFIYPYLEIEHVSSSNGGNQYYPLGVWPKGNTSSDKSNLITDVKNVFVIDYPVDVDDNRFNIVLSKEYKTEAEKAQSIYFTMNIDDLFDADGQYITTAIDVTPNNGTETTTNAYQLYPSLIKYEWLFEGSTAGGNGMNGLRNRNGDMMVMRTAEVYLIAAEACQQLGDGATAARYLNVLRNRAARTGTTAPQLSTASEEDILDEYAREMAGEFMRWALLKRHHALETRLPLYNTRAAQNFDSSIHYCRPVSYDFLQQIENPDEYGDNGYGTTASKGY